jgi:hypothetical protein
MPAYRKAYRDLLSPHAVVAGNGRRCAYFAEYTVARREDVQQIGYAGAQLSADRAIRRVCAAIKMDGNQCSANASQVVAAYSAAFPAADEDQDAQVDENDVRLLCVCGKHGFSRDGAKKKSFLAGRMGDMAVQRLYPAQ